MTILVLCNVGLRDVQRDGKKLEPARAEGERLLNRLKEDAAIGAHLSLPIIEPCLRYIIEQHPGDKNNPGGVDRLILYGTDQKDEKQQARDTLYFAELAALTLAERLGSALRRVEPRYIQHINPALYDEAFEAFRHLLAELPKEGIDLCYIILCSGIPACNTALLFQGVRQYGKHLRVVYQPEGGEPQELRAGLQLEDAFSEAAAIEHLRRLDFSNAIPFLERIGCSQGLIGLVTYASQREAFDFQSAKATMEQTLRDGEPAVREFIRQRLRHDLDSLLEDGEGPDRLAALLRELYWNASITYDHRRWADFLGRVFRFQEAVLRLLVERTFNLPTDLKPSVSEKNQRLWEEGIRANSSLLNYLEKRTFKGKRLDWTRIARPAYQTLMKYATDPKRGVDATGNPMLSEPDRDRIAAALDRINGLDDLVELRHRTIIGHDFQGVSEELLREAYKGKRKDGRQRTPIEGLEEILGMLDVNLRNNPYQQIADFVTQQLQES